MLHEHTTIYVRALELNAVAARVIRGLPGGFGFLADQLRRAASSVALNFAEGNGYPEGRQRANCFRIARGSAKEVAAILDVAAQYDIVTPELLACGKKLSDELGAMLFRWR